MAPLRRKPQAPRPGEPPREIDGRPTVAVLADRAHDRLVDLGPLRELPERGERHATVQGFIFRGDRRDQRSVGQAENADMAEMQVGQQAGRSRQRPISREIAGDHLEHRDGIPVVARQRVADMARNEQMLVRNLRYLVLEGAGQRPQREHCDRNGRNRDEANKQK